MTRMRALAAIAGWMVGLVALCTSCATPLPEAPPPLADMEEPLQYFQEPADEQARQALPLGTFTGCYVGESRQSLESLLGDAEGVEVVRLVENSPAAVAGLAVGDLLIEARIAGGEPRKLQRPADWRKVELDAKPGDEVAVRFDRANRRSRTTMVVVPRVAAPERGAVRRIREEERVGVVLRTATEVEARAAGLGPGGGAVIVGLAKKSPWRTAGLEFGDLIVAVDGHEVADPEVVVEQIRAAGDRITVEFVRDGRRSSVVTPLTRRAQELRELWIPVLVDYERTRGKSDTSILLGLFRHVRTKAAWRVRLFWFIRFGGGDADELLEVDS